MNEIFEPRINQLEAFRKIDEEITTGIHCQATGCGKSYIILYYINVILQKYGKDSKIILFTERIDILKDFFELDCTSKNNIDKWKKIGIVDLTNIKIINCVTKKDRNFIEEFNNNPNCLLLINRNYLTLSSYDSFNTIHIILHDECHNASSPQCFKFLDYMKKKNIPIIGFSATPVRSNIHELEKTKKIYSINGKINLLTDFNMVHSISENLILPPEFYWYNYDNKIEESIIDELIKILPQLFYKKIIVWCKTIKNTKEWKNKFEKNKKIYNELSNFKLYIDTSSTQNNDYNNFYKEENNCILFCATKHREGSDIPNLDCCLFADCVKQRGMIPFIQSIGRVLRKNKNKNKGIIIEGIKINSSIDITNKIIEYYMALYNSCTDNNSRIDNLKKLSKHINFNHSNNKVCINIENKSIYINIENNYWNDLSNNFKKHIDKNIKSLKQNEEKNIIYTKSKIQKCIIKHLNIEKKIEKNNYKYILECIYIIINDYDKISKDITWIKKGKYIEHGYRYLEKLDISIQGQDSNTCMREILKKSKENNISINMEILLVDKSLHTINI